MLYAHLSVCSYRCCRNPNKICLESQKSLKKEREQKVPGCIEDCSSQKHYCAKQKRGTAGLATHKTRNISVTDSLGCSDPNIVGFGILLSTQRVSTKGKGLDFRRANSSSHRAQWGVTPWEASTEDKGARSFFKNVLPETQKQFIPFKSKGSEPHGLTELASLLKTKREIYLGWKSRQIPTESYKGTARACRDAFEKQNLSLT